MRWRLARGAVLVVATSIAMWPMMASAIAGDESRGGGSGQAVGQHRRAQYFYVPAAGTLGHGPDPDTWDFATKSGYFRVVLDGSGTSEEAPPDAEPSNCVPSGGEMEVQQDLPTMRIDSDPPGPEFGGLGGVVNVPTYFWVSGDFHGEPVLGPPAQVHVVNCVVRNNRLVEQTEDHSARVRYTLSSGPDWIWGDGRDPDSGWGVPFTPAVSHTFQVSSARCGPPNCLNVPDKGPSYVVEFDLSLTIQYIYDGAVVDSSTFPEARHRVLPVREVQSIIEH